MTKIGCETCAAVCCNDILVPLTRPEVDFMESGGTDLHEFLPAIPGVSWKETTKGETSDDPELQWLLEVASKLKTNYGSYKIKGSCGYLVEADGQKLCSAHENPERPKICRKFRAGSPSCQYLRFKRGVDEYPSTIVQFIMRQKSEAA